MNERKCPTIVSADRWEPVGAANRPEGLPDPVWAGSTTEVVRELRRRVMDIYRDAQARGSRRGWEQAAKAMVRELAGPHLPPWGMGS